MSGTGGDDGGGTPDGGAPPPTDAGASAPSSEPAQDSAPPVTAEPASDPQSSSEPEPDAQSSPAPDSSQDPGTTAPQPAADPQADDPSTNSSSATDEHHDWVHQTMGVDPRTYSNQEPAADGGTCEPGQPDPAPAEAAPAEPADDGAPADPAEPADGGAPADPPDGGAADPAPQDAGAPDPGNDTPGDPKDADGDGASGSPDPVPPQADTGADGAPAADAGAAAPAEPEESLFDRALDAVGFGPKAKAEAARKETVDNAQKELLGKTEEQLQQMSPDEKAKYIKDLTANGPPKGVDKGALNRIYENTPTDPDYLKQQDQQSDQAAKELANDPAMKAAQANWPNMSDDEKAEALRKVVAAQSKAMGIPAPEIVIEKGMKEGGMTVSGVYKPEDGKLHLNTDPDSMVANFPDAVSIATHENTHNYQDRLVKAYQDGTLKPDDPAYNQAKMLAANNGPGAYVEPDSKNIDLYKQQPVERDAWNNGTQTSRKILHGLAGTGP